MTVVATQPDAPIRQAEAHPIDRDALREELQREIEGEVRFDSILNRYGVAVGGAFRTVRIDAADKAGILLRMLKAGSDKGSVACIVIGKACEVIACLRTG